MIIFREPTVIPGIVVLIGILIVYLIEKKRKKDEY